VADSRARRPGAADGRARRDDREHRAAFGAGGARLLERLAAVDRDRVRARVRQPAPARRPDRRRLRPQARTDRELARLRGRVGSRWSRSELRVAARSASAAGDVRRAAGPLRARAADDDVHRASRPQQGLRDLRRGRRQRRRGRAAARRGAHRVPLLALVPLREPVPGAAGRRRRGDAGSCAAADEQAQHRPARGIHGRRRPVPDRLRLRPRPDQRLEYSPRRSARSSAASRCSGSSS
jgi:hypothetical protein